MWNNHLLCWSCGKELAFLNYFFLRDDHLFSTAVSFILLHLFIFILFFHFLLGRSHFLGVTKPFPGLCKFQHDGIMAMVCVTSKMHTIAYRKPTNIGCGGYMHWRYWSMYDLVPAIASIWGERPLSHSLACLFSVLKVFSVMQNLPSLIYPVALFLLLFHIHWRFLPNLHYFLSLWLYDFVLFSSGSFFYLLWNDFCVGIKFQSSDYKYTVFSSSHIERMSLIYVLGYLIKNHLAKITWVYFCIPYSIPLCFWLV